MKWGSLSVISLVLVLASLIAGPVFAQNTSSVSLDKQLLTAEVMPGQSVDLELTTTNNIEFQTSNRPLVSYRDFAPSIDETIDNVITSDGSYVNGISAWIGGTTGLINLGQDQANIITFSVTVPAAQEPGAYSGVVSIDYNNADAQPESVYAVVAINVGASEPNIAPLEAGSTVFDIATGAATATVTNIGVHHLDANARLEILKDGAISQILPLVSARSEGLFPITTRVYRTDELVNQTLLEALDNTYSVELVISAGQLDVFRQPFPGLVLPEPEDAEAEAVVVEAEPIVTDQAQSDVSLNPTNTPGLVEDVKDDVGSNRLYYIASAAVAAVLGLVMAAYLWRRRRRVRGGVSMAAVPSPQAEEGVNGSYLEANPGQAVTPDSVATAKLTASSTAGVPLTNNAPDTVISSQTAGVKVAAAASPIAVATVGADGTSSQPKESPIQVSIDGPQTAPGPGASPPPSTLIKPSIEPSEVSSAIEDIARVANGGVAPASIFEKPDPNDVKGAPPLPPPPSNNTGVFIGGDLAQKTQPSVELEEHPFITPDPVPPTTVEPEDSTPNVEPSI